MVTSFSQLLIPKSLDDSLTCILFLLPHPATSNNSMFTVYLESDHFQHLDCCHICYHPLLGTVMASWSNNIIILFKFPVLKVPSLSKKKKAQGLWYSPRPIHNLCFLSYSWNVTCPKAFINAVCSIWNALLPRLRHSLPGTLIKKSLSSLKWQVLTISFLLSSKIPINN